MASLICILTYNRFEVLNRLLKGLVDHTPLEHTIAIFDDCSTKDNTQPNLLTLPEGLDRVRPEITALATKLECRHALKHVGAHDVHVFLGDNNLGVAGNSNRAIALFDLLKGNDHLFLLNDDLLFFGDATSTYAKAHNELDIGLLCFNNLQGDVYRWATVPIRGWNVKIFERMTGAAMSITRNLFNRIGYFDTRFPKMENEHCDYTNRARLTGFMNVLGKPQGCIDIETGFPPQLDHQHDATPTVSGLTRQEWNRESMTTMSQKVREYQMGRFHEPFSLRSTPYVNCHAGFDRGVPVAKMLGVDKPKGVIIPHD